MISPATARDAFIVPALTRIGHYSLDAEKLLMGTAAIESSFTYFVQFGGGPARGMFQMEAATFDDLMHRVLSTKAHRKLRSDVLATAKTPNFFDITHNHLFAAAMARVKYFSIRAPIPAGLEHQAYYWWTYYNGRSPHGLKPGDYVTAWHKYCAPLYATKSSPPEAAPFPSTVRV